VKLKNLLKVLFYLLFFTTYLFGGVKIDNGKAYLVEFDKVENCKIKYGSKTIYPIPHPINKNKLIAFLPVEYKTKLKKKFYHIYSNDKKVLEGSLKITKGNYKKEILKVSKKYVKPKKKNNKRIEKEYLEAMKLYSTTTKQNFLIKKFAMPINSKITSKYGNARIFNGNLKSYHSGTDFRAKVGTKIKSINDGKVVLVKNRYYAGGSIIVDHGFGIYSCYYHLSKFNVKVGDVVQKGDVIALSGKSGRITGPHLHLTIKIYGTTVAPLNFITKYNNLFENIK
jgi:murein DD-endopeptidase MepM/ murein hydrolase activator NlpD